MVLPVSGIVHLFGFFVILLFGLRSLFIAKKENIKIALFFGIGFVLLALGRLFLATPALLFLEDKVIWFWCEIIQRSSLVIGFAFLGYAIFLGTFLKKHVNKIFVFLLLISFIIIIGFFLNPPHYFIRENGVLDWENIPVVFAFLNFIYILILCIFAIFIFLKEAYLARDKKIKVRSLILALVFFWVILPALFDFIVVPFLKVNPIVSEINYFICYFLILMSVVIGYLVEEKK